MYSYTVKVYAGEGIEVAAFLKRAKMRLCEPWFRAVLYLCVIPLLPEYMAPVMVIVAVVAALRDAKRSAQPITLGTIGWVLLAFVVFFAVSAPFAAQPMSALTSTGLWVMMFGGYLALTTVLRERQRLNDTLFMVTLVLGVVGTIGCVQYFLRFIGYDNAPLQVWAWLDKRVYSIFPFRVDLRIDGVRVCSTFGNPNILSQYLVMTIPFAAYHAFHAPQHRRRGISRFCLLAAIGCVAFTFSRGAYIALAAATVVLVIANRRHIVTILMSALAAMLLIPDAVWNRVVSLGKLDVSGLERIAAWDICLEVIAAHPVFGTGCGIFYTWQVLSAAGTNAPHAHNTILQILVEGGIVALCLLLYLAFHIIHSGFMLIRRRESEQLGFAFLTFVAAYGVQAMVEYAFTFPVLVGTFAVVLALTDNATRLYCGRPVTALQRKKTKKEKVG